MLSNALHKMAIRIFVLLNQKRTRPMFLNNISSKISVIIRVDILVYQFFEEKALTESEKKSKIKNNDLCAMLKMPSHRVCNFLFNS